MQRKNQLLTIAVIVLANVISGLTAGVAGACPNWTDAATRHLTDQELSSCSCGELEILRNEIYARHGRIFRRDDLQRYFQAQSWYRADANNPDGNRGQNQYEQQNAVRILNFEKRVGCKPGTPSSSAPPPAPSSDCPVWPAQQTRYLSEAELAGCSCRDLELLRNEIYARHGRVFNRDDLQRYFQAQPWYRADANNTTGEKGQNAYERSNATRILNYEKKIGCRTGAPSSSTPPPAPTSYCPVWPAQQTRYLNDAELSACSCGELELLRNEIYARHGRIFNRNDLQRYFQAQSWYRADAGNPTGEKGQNQYERSNAVTILNHEKARGCR